MTNEMKYFDFSKEPGKYLKEDKPLSNDEPLISVLTAYYNAKEFIEQTANSIINQTFPYWEWLIIDDGSTQEGTKEFLEELAKKDSRIKILHKKNGGCSSARYYGAKHAKADIVCFLDSDDLVDETVFECAYWTLQTNPNATWAYSNSTGFGSQQYLWDKKFDLEIEKKENILIVASFIRKKALLEFKEYETLEKGIYEDWYMWMNFFKKGYYPVRMNYYGLWYRRLEKSMLSGIRKNKKQHTYAMAKIKKIASEIKNNIKAVEYPILSYSNKIIDTPFKNWKNKLKYKDNNKTDVLFVLPWAVVGGADKFNIDLIKGLNKKKYRITVLLTLPSSYIWRQKLEEHATVFDLTSFLKKEEWFDFVKYIIETRNIKLIFNSNSMYGYHAIPLIKAYFPAIPIIDYLHNEEMNWNNGGYPRESVIVSRLLDKTYTCTNYLKKLMSNRMNRNIDNVEPIYIGTDEKYFDPNKVSLEENELYQKIKNKKIIIFPCRISNQKRPMLMIEIVAKLIKKDKNIVVLVIGDGDLKSMVINKAAAMGLTEENLIFLPNQSDMRPFYKMANLLLICSMYEGLTLTTYEALAMNVPVITSDVGGQAELVDETCGKVIPLFQDPEKDIINYKYKTEEINAYIKAIMELLKNKNIIKNCRNKIIPKFTIDKMVERFEAEFDSLIKNGSSIDKVLCNNIELANNYLTKSCMLDSDYFMFSSGSASLRKLLKDRLWRYSLWRGFVKFCKITRLNKLKNIISK